MSLLLSRLFRHRSKKASNLRVIGPCAGIHRGPVNYPHERPVTRKMFPFDDVIMDWSMPPVQVNRRSLVGNKKLWCYRRRQPDQVVDQRVEWPVIWDAMTLIWHHSYVNIWINKQYTSWTKCSMLRRSWRFFELLMKLYHWSYYTHFRMCFAGNHT